MKALFWILVISILTGINLAVGLAKLGPGSSAILGMAVGQALIPFLLAGLFALREVNRNAVTLTKVLVWSSMLIFLVNFNHLGTAIRNLTREEPPEVSEAPPPDPEQECVERVMVVVDRTGDLATEQLGDAESILAEIRKVELQGCPTRFIELLTDWTLTLEDYTLPKLERPPELRDRFIATGEDLVYYASELSRDQDL